MRRRRPRFGQADLLSGQTDNSFGNGTKTSDVNVTVASGAIPNNKADLGQFYMTSETLANGDVMMYLGVPGSPPRAPSTSTSRSTRRLSPT